MMADIKIAIGGREFEVACRDGEEHFLQSAAGMLDKEASALNDALGRMPETRMLLMAGLMLADKTASLEDKLKAGTDGSFDKGVSKRIADVEKQLYDAQAELLEVKAKLTEAEAEAMRASESNKAAVKEMHAMVDRLENTARVMAKVG
jgi:cell division protein ZapA